MKLFAKITNGLKMLCCCYDKKPEREGSISSFNINGQLTDIQVTYRCPTFPVNYLILKYTRIFAVCEALQLMVRLVYHS